MAHLTGLHAAGRSLGTALADAGFSELRFVRLLRATDDTLLRLAIEAARFLAAKAQPSNQVDLALLVLSDGWTDASARERVRRQLARGYYDAPSV
jgi:CRISPR system Cascade subunit CasB